MERTTLDREQMLYVAKKPDRIMNKLLLPLDGPRNGAFGFFFFAAD